MSIKLGIDTGNGGYNILCNFGGRIISGFEVGAPIPLPVTGSKIKALAEGCLNGVKVYFIKILIRMMIFDICCPCDE